jgi:hypothetical protein
VSGDERVRRLRGQADLEQDVAGARLEMRDADRAYAMGLAGLGASSENRTTSV